MSNSFTNGSSVTSANALAPVALDALPSAVATAACNKQWNLVATFGANAAKVLARFNGAGVSIGHYDDGIDLSSGALSGSYNAALELTVDGALNDPTKGAGVHGTATASIMVANPNQDGGAVTGFAFGAQLTSFNIFDSSLTSAGMIAAIAGMAKFDVCNASWGWTKSWSYPVSDGTGFGAAFSDALASAAAKGRQGLGTIIVESAGNSWASLCNANESEFTADRHVIAVGAVTQTGGVAYYSNRGSNLLVSAASSGGGDGIATINKSGGITNTFGGTSAAAPEVSGVVADMLSANSSLGWRDVQNILAITATDNDAKKIGAFHTTPMSGEVYGWTINGANDVNGGGLHYSNDVGFGAVNGYAALREAEVWSYFGQAQTSANEQQTTVAAAAGSKAITPAGASFSFNASAQIDVETVSLKLGLNTTNLDNLTITLVSPDGTKSILLSPSQGTQSASDFVWTFESQAFRGELSSGQWQVVVQDANASDTGAVLSASLQITGSTPTNAHVFHYTDEALIMDKAAPSRVLLNDPTGVGAWIDTAATTQNLSLNLNSGASSTMNGGVFVTIATGTTINNATLGDGQDHVVCNNNGDTIVCGYGYDVVAGGAGDDTVIAGWGGGSLTGGGGDDTYKFNHTGFGAYSIADFTQGRDVIDLSGLGVSMTDLSFNASNGAIAITVDSSGDRIVLANTHISQLNQSDFVFSASKLSADSLASAATSSVSFDASGAAGEAYRLYQAALKRTPDAAGLGYWINAIEQGETLTDVAQGFINSAEFQGLYGAHPTDQAFVAALYENVLGRAPEASGLSFWLNQMSNGESKADVLIGFSDSLENKQHLSAAAQSGMFFAAAH